MIGSNKATGIEITIFDTDLDPVVIYTAGFVNEIGRLIAERISLFEPASPSTGNATHSPSKGAF